MTLFDTETMAELHHKQGRTADAVAIYRRLVERAADEATRARRRLRLAELERGAAAGEDAPPDVALDVRRDGEQVVLAWTLPDAIRAPALQLLLVRRTAAGVQTEARTLRLQAPRGGTVVSAPALHSLRAAAGRLEGDRFIPLVRRQL